MLQKRLLTLRAEITRLLKRQYNWKIFHQSNLLLKTSQSSLHVQNRADDKSLIERFLSRIKKKCYYNTNLFFILVSMSSFLLCLQHCLFVLLIELAVVLGHGWTLPEAGHTLWLTKICLICTLTFSMQFPPCVWPSLDQSQYLSTYPSPNPALTLTCYPLTDVRKGRGKGAIAQILTSIPL